MIKFTEAQQQVKRFFGIKELVCKHVYDRWGEDAWQFIDDKLLEVLYIIRLYLDKPIVVNNWAKGGSYSQRGLRCNVCALVREKSNLEKVYISAHLQGKGVDFHVPGLTSAQVIDFIVNIKRQLPHPIRIELDTEGWVHVDIRNSSTTEKIVFFKG